MDATATAPTLNWFFSDPTTVIPAGAVVKMPSGETVTLDKDLLATETILAESTETGAWVGTYVVPGIGEVEVLVGVAPVYED